MKQDNLLSIQEFANKINKAFDLENKLFDFYSTLSEYNEVTFCESLIKEEIKRIFFPYQVSIRLNDKDINYINKVKTFIKNTFYTKQLSIDDLISEFLKSINVEINSFEYGHVGFSILDYLGIAFLTARMSSELFKDKLDEVRPFNHKERFDENWYNYTRIYKKGWYVDVLTLDSAHNPNNQHPSNVNLNSNTLWFRFGDMDYWLPYNADSYRPVNMATILSANRQNEIFNIKNLTRTFKTLFVEYFNAKNIDYKKFAIHSFQGSIDKDLNFNVTITLSQPGLFVGKRGEQIAGFLYAINDMFNPLKLKLMLNEFNPFL
jgi:hypothetical protein